ncbi:MAG: L,D-transpeptidase family protein [Anaerolineae bacterium]
MAAIAEEPQEAVGYLSEVLRAHPDHQQALEGLRWAYRRAEAKAPAPTVEDLPAKPQLRTLPSVHRASWPRKLTAALVLCLGLVGAGVAALAHRTAAEMALRTPTPAALAFEIAPIAAGNTQMIELPPLYPEGPDVEPTTDAVALLPVAGETAQPTVLPFALDPLPEATPLAGVPTAAPLPSLEPTAAPTPTALPPQPAATATAQLATAKGAEAQASQGRTGKWIEVILSKQVAIAWNGNTPVRRMVVSTGIARYPTVTGTYRIYLKRRAQRMVGPGYDLPNVPHVMYFYRGYALHGTYWHKNFGRPMSHGCVNLKLADAAWLFNWTGPVLPEGSWNVWASAKNPGTLVVIHW